MKVSLKNVLDKSIDTLYDRYFRDKRNTEIVISRVLQQIEDDRQQQVSFPSAYVELLRGCIEAKRLNVKTIKKNESQFDSNDALKKFSTLIAILETNPIPIEINTAKEIALIADYFRNIPAVYRESNWMGDTHTHFASSSSFGEKGRILNTVIRVMRSQQCIELGTAYGMSALFIMEALQAIGNSGKLDTIEGGTSQYNLSSKILQKRYGDRINCHLGLTQTIVPKIIKSGAEIDFVFHDAGHRKENYIRDFNNLLPALKSGAIFIIDDIRWEEPLLSMGNAHCYAGWKEIVDNPRVVYAVEVNKNLGMALIN